MSRALPACLPAARPRRRSAIALQITSAGIDRVIAPDIVWDGLSGAGFLRRSGSRARWIWLKVPGSCSSAGQQSNPCYIVRHVLRSAGPSFRGHSLGELDRRRVYSAQAQSASSHRSDRFPLCVCSKLRRKSCRTAALRRWELDGISFPLAGLSHDRHCARPKSMRLKVTLGKSTIRLSA
jgi:hypothetical protein